MVTNVGLRLCLNESHDTQVPEQALRIRDTQFQSALRKLLGVVLRN